MLDRGALFRIQAGIGIGRCAFVKDVLGKDGVDGIWHGEAALEMPALYIYPVD
jgi:hypothetical protein